MAMQNYWSINMKNVCDNFIISFSFKKVFKSCKGSTAEKRKAHGRAVQCSFAKCAWIKYRNLAARKVKT